jgi:hypothetical protein
MKKFSDSDKRAGDDALLGAVPAVVSRHAIAGNHSGAR